MKRHTSVDWMINMWCYFGRNDAPGVFDLVMTMRWSGFGVDDLTRADWIWGRP